jgi:four helix bundle protein
VAWQLANSLRQLIVRHTDNGPILNDFRFRDQIRDAVSSACRNTSEGFYKYRHSEFKRYLNIARGSLGETLDAIEDGLQRNYFSEETAREMTNPCDRAMIAHLRLMQTL